MLSEYSFQRAERELNDDLLNLNDVLSRENPLKINDFNELEMNLNDGADKLRDEVEENLDDKSEYEPGYLSSMFDIKLKIGSKIIPQYSCANYKLNCALRNSILAHEPLNHLLSGLSKFVSNSKKKIEIARLLRKTQTKLVSDNRTRWGSSFLMLLSFLKAKRLNIFSQEILAEFDLNVLEIYYQLLLPIHKLNLLFERTNSNIGEVIPLLNMTIYINKFAL